MRNSYLEILIFIIATSVVSLLLIYKVDYHSLQLGVLALLITILFLLQFQVNRIEKILNTNVRFGYLFLFSLFIELLVVSTGGIGSHFLLLASLYVLALSFLIDIYSSLIFLLLFSGLLVFQAYLDPNIQTLIFTDPTVIVLLVLTFIIVGSLAIVLNEYYHFKDVFVEVLKKKIVQEEHHEETILSNFSELIIITDLHFNIVSVNEAVEKSIQHSKSQLIRQNLFKSFALKNKDNYFLTKENIKIDDIAQQPLYIDELSLISNIGQESVLYSLTVKPILDLDGQLYQLIFILRNTELDDHADQAVGHVIDQIITKQQAIIEDLRTHLIDKGEHDLEFKAAMVGKLDREIQNLIDLSSDSIDREAGSIKIDRVVQNTCDVMKSFADALHVDLDFKLINKNLNVNEQTTDVTQILKSNLFTAKINLKWLDIMLHKLTEMSILLASSSEKPQVTINLERNGDKIFITIRDTFQHLKKEEVSKLFEINYADLQLKTNLRLASGLEGYIARKISAKLALPLQVVITEDGISFILAAQAVS